MNNTHILLCPLHLKQIFFFFKDQITALENKTMGHYYLTNTWDLGLNHDFSHLKSMHICPSLIFPEGCTIIAASAAAASVIVVLESPVFQHLILKG